MRRSCQGADTEVRAIRGEPRAVRIQAALTLFQQHGSDHRALFPGTLFPVLVPYVQGGLQDELNIYPNVCVNISLNVYNLSESVSGYF